MYKKQNTNDFAAFKSMFDSELLKAIENKNIEQIEEILNTKYKYEADNNFYTQVEIDLAEIEKISKILDEELKNNPSLIYKL